MTQHGGLLTEYFTHTVPDKGNFVRRNRIVAGLSAATLVIESADKGGAPITANLAASYGREVMAYPGRITDRYSAGCNQLIRDNKATLVTSAADILSLLRWKAQSAEAPRYKQMELFPCSPPSSKPSSTPDRCRQSQRRQPFASDAFLRVAAHRPPVRPRRPQPRQTPARQPLPSGKALAAKH